MSDEVISALRARLLDLIQQDATDPASPFSQVFRGPRSTEISFTAYAGSYEGVIAMGVRLLPAGAAVRQDGDA